VLRTFRALTEKGADNGLYARFMSARFNDGQREWSLRPSTSTQGVKSRSSNLPMWPVLYICGEESAALMIQLVTSELL